MSHILDRPIWSALHSRHASLAEGGELAKRYPETMSAFSAVAEVNGDSTSALASLTKPGGTILQVQAMSLAQPAGFETFVSATLVQMTADRPLERVSDERIKPLGWLDAADMLELASMTKPGPFSLRAQDFGPFWGIREGGRLIAMAGNRLRQPGFTELSGVCVHPEYQGKGLGRLMSLYVAERIQESGDVPYLHAYSTNAQAIGLYEKIGFRLRERMNMSIMRRPD
jgi:ribosomal protein S18 acetylase RimI-like enzyme